MVERRSFVSTAFGHVLPRNLTLGQELTRMVQVRVPGLAGGRGGAEQQQLQQLLDALSRSSSCIVALFASDSSAEFHIYSDLDVRRSLYSCQTACKCSGGAEASCSEPQSKRSSVLLRNHLTVLMLIQACDGEERLLAAA